MSWDALALGYHRAVVEVASAADAPVGDAARVRIPWRRRDERPEEKDLIVTDAGGARIVNVARLAISREIGDLAFQPASGPGVYYVYYLPFTSSGRVNYPTVAYPPPAPNDDADWLRRNGLAGGGAAAALPEARCIALQGASPFDDFTPMERIATRQEVDALLARHPDAPYLLFPEDRALSIRMTGDLPQRWIDAGPGQPARGQAAPGEFFAFQIGLYAARDEVRQPGLIFGELRPESAGTVIPASAFRCINLGGVDWAGRDFQKTLAVPRGRVQALWCGAQVPDDAAPGDYTGQLVFTAAGAPPTVLPVALRVAGEPLPAHGDDEPWRLSRLRWLDSRIAVDDEVVAPFTPVEVRGDLVSILGRQLAVGAGGLPARIGSFFTPEVTGLAPAARELLAGPIAFVHTLEDGAAAPWTAGPPAFVKRAPGAAAWEASAVSGPLAYALRAEMECDGCVEVALEVRAERDARVGDLRLDIPLVPDAARYAMGLGLKGGRRPAALDWKWDREKNQDALWIGDVNAGLQVTLKDERYERPLNTNFYQLKPLILPRSWHNDGRGGVRMAERDGVVVVSCHSGPRAMQAGETLRFDFRLLLTPFKPLDTAGQWSTRYYHRHAPLDEILAAGGNTVNVHHATPINPYINYPFFQPDEMRQYADEAHRRGCRVKIYYTVRELTNRAPELFALRSLGDEVLSGGPGGGPAWLQEHLGSDYIAGWYVPDLQDAAVINSGMSRWLNFYLEGLDWLARNVGIDGLYIDDVAYDRVVMKRVRKILDRRRPAALIDLHSANQYNPRDGYANSANLYLEHFPYLNRLWFGEYFDYANAPPDFWLVEISGIPFGLMGEMLQDGGNPWRGLLYGMTSRLPWAGDPRPVWRAWDDFGIQDSRMLGYWSPDCPVRADRPDVLATVYARPGRALVALASWAPEPVAVRLAVDWQALGIDPAQARLRAPAMHGMQEEATFSAGDAILVEPGRGKVLIINP